MEIFNPGQAQHSISKTMMNQKAEGLFNQMKGAKKSGSSLDSVSQDFEAIFLHKMIESMRAGVPKSGLLDSFSMDMFQSMMDQEIANEMAKGQGIGLAKMLKENLASLEEKLQQQANNMNDGNPKPMITIDLRGEQ